MKSKLLKWALVAKLAIASLTGINIVHADELTVCDGCTYDEMEAQFYHLVNQAPVPTSSTIYVVDYTNNRARKWTFRKYYDETQWYCDPRYGATPYECLAWTDAEELPVEQSVVTYVDFVNVHKGDVVPLTRDPILFRDPADYPQDGYALVLNPNAQLLVSQYIDATGVGVLQDLRTLIGMLPPFNLNPDNLGMRVTVRTADGSTHSFVYNPQRDRWELEPRSSRDPEGNPIPVTREDITLGVPGTSITYDFNDNYDALIDFLTRMHNLGVPITGPVGSLDDARITCTNRTEKGPNGEERHVVECRRG
jgi:hypothetical protein